MYRAIMGLPGNALLPTPAGTNFFTLFWGKAGQNVTSKRCMDEVIFLRPAPRGRQTGRRTATRGKKERV